MVVTCVVVVTTEVEDDVEAAELGVGVEDGEEVEGAVVVVACVVDARALVDVVDEVEGVVDGAAEEGVEDEASAAEDVGDGEVEGSEEVVEEGGSSEEDDSGVEDEGTAKTQISRNDIELEENLLPVDEAAAEVVAGAVVA